MRRIALSIGLLCSVLVASSAAAGLRYRFTTTTEGMYESRGAGDVVVDGAQWRVDYAYNDHASADLTSVIGRNGELVALHTPTLTWFRLLSPNRLAIRSNLFSFGTDARASNVVISAPSVADGTTRIAFSYRIEFGVEGGARVGGDVWGEMRIWTARDVPAGLPWSPIDVQTGFDAVDQPFRAALGKLAGGGAVRSELVISRRLDGGATLTHTIKRTISDFKAATTHESDFSVPSIYRYQEPLIGAPGAR